METFKPVLPRVRCGILISLSLSENNEQDVISPEAVITAAPLADF
ncbi:hypothetical protein ES708_32995 [subsurface metagenome]